MKTGPWRCDTCGRPIKKAKDGYLEWLVKKDTYEGYGLHLVHHKPASPLGGFDGCYYDETKHWRQDGAMLASRELDYYLGDEGLVNLLEMIHGNWVDKNEGIEMIMRLHTPGYEQARAHIQSAIDEEVIKDKEFPEFRTLDEIKEVNNWVKFG